MKRTIKFRGHSIHSNEWVYGSLLKIGDNYHILGDNDMYEDGHHIRQESDFPTWVDPKTIGQFTGLYDKNGKEIYDGDIIYSEFPDGSKTNCLIGWNEENSCFGLMDEYNYRSKLEGYDFQRFDNAIFCNFSKHSKKFEVIGNIYDNPELLKGGEK